MVSIRCGVPSEDVRDPSASSLPKQLDVILLRSSSNLSARDMVDRDEEPPEEGGGGPPGAPGGRRLSLLGLEPALGGLRERGVPSMVGGSQDTSM
jgi:hypothetical protein